MEIINSRYKIINKISNSIPYVQEFLAADLWSENTKINLKIISSLDIKKEELDFFKDNFITISNIDNYFYLKNYGFSSLHIAYPSLTRSTPDEMLYIFTTEHIENAIPVLKFVEKCSMEDILKIAVSVCQCLVHTSNMGFEYEVFTHNDVMIVEEKNGFRVRIKDIVSAKLENSQSIWFKKAEDYMGNTENINAVISFIVTLLAKKEIKTNISSALSKLKTAYKTLNKKDERIFNTLYEIAKKYTQHKDKNNKIHKIIQDINSKLNINYPADVIHPLNSITFRPRLVGKQKEIDMVLQARNEIYAKQAKKTVFLVKGNQGTGKTRFLKESEYRLSLEGTNIYVNYNLRTSTVEKFWDDFLGKIFLNSYLHQNIGKRENIIKKIKQIRNRKFAGNAGKEYDHLKFKVFNEAKNLFFKAIGQLPLFLIIDDVEFANDFLLDVILYLTTEITELERLGIILSYYESVTPVSSKFASFLNILNNYEKCQTVELNYFSEEETIEILKNILLLKYPPVNFGPRLYKHTSGCPSFVIEMIKEFINTGAIYREHQTGIWLVKNEIYEEDLQNKIPKSIEETLTNQLDVLSTSEKKILLESSLFQNNLKIEYLYKILPLSSKQIDKNIKKLIDKGLITVIKSGIRQKYAITNKIMHDILYKSFEPKHKMLQHKKIAAILKKESDSDINEFIWHLKESCNEKALLACYLGIIKQKLKTKDINAVVKIYEKNPSVIMGQSAINRFKILLKIFELYNQMALKDKEAKIKLILEADLQKIKNSDLISYYYNLVVRYEYPYLNDSEILVYVNKLSDLYEKSPCDIINLRLQHAKCLYYHITQHKSGFKEATYKILEITKNNPEYAAYKAEAYIFLAYIYYGNSNKRIALKYFKKAKKTASLSGNNKTEILAMYNIALIHWEIYPNIEKNLSYMKNVISLTKEHGFLLIEIVSIINYAKMLTEIQNNDEAYKYAKEAEDKIFTYDLTILKLPCITALMEITQNLTKYKEFYKYKKMYIKIARENKIKSAYETNFIFYSLVAIMYQKFGYNNKAIAYLKKSLKIKKYQPAGKIFIVYYMLESLRIIKKDKTDISRLIKIFNSYMKSNQSIESTKRKLTKNLFDSIAMMSMKRPDIDFTPLIMQIIKFDSPELSDLQISGMNYLKIYLNKTDREQVLKMNLNIMSSKNLINITFFISMALADYYYASGMHSLAVVYYLEIQNKIAAVIKNTPEKYRDKLFNNLVLSKPFDIVSDFIEGKNITKGKKYNRIIDKSELKELLKLKHVNIIKKDKEFRKELIETHLKNEGYEYTTSVEIFNSFTGSYKRNTAGVMKFLALNVIASSYEFLDISSHDEPYFVLNQKNTDSNLQKLFEIITKFEYKNITEVEKAIHKPCMIIPVNKWNFSTGNYTTLGFMIFISESIINNFSHEGRNFCKKHSNLLTMLAESKNFRQASAYDLLTGAYTRKYFEFFLKNIIKNLYNSHSKFSLILYDLDKFKNINDTYGHLVGDIVLKKVSQTILNSLHQDQILGRYGGEEFTIILPNTDSEKAFKIAEHFRKKIENLIFTELERSVTISLGIATFPEHGKTISELIEIADQALYHSKNTGRNKTTVWNSAIIGISANKTNQTGIVIADESSFGKNVTATIEVCDILKQNIAKQDLPKTLLTKIVEFFHAESGAIILISVNKKTNTSVFKISTKIGFDAYPINEQLIYTVAENGSGIFQVDWDSITKRDSITNMPEWNSVMIAPMIKNEKIIGMIYLAVPEKHSKFNLSKFNFFKFLADIVSANI